MPDRPARRILSVSPVSDGGGSEHCLIRMIRRLTTDGWECHVALPSPVALEDQYRAAGAVLHPVPTERLTTRGSSLRWLRYVLRWPVTVLHLARLARGIDAGVVHSNSLHTWHGWAAAWLARRPHVWHAREIVFQSGAALSVERFLTRHFAVRVVAMSEAIAGQLDPSNLVVIHDDADPEAFRPERAGGFRASAAIRDHTPLVGSVARLDTWKGFDVLLNAFPQIRAARPDVELAVVGLPVPGKEAYAAELQRQAESTAGVHWIGPRSDPGEVMADLDVFVQVSTEPEPFGLVVVEALASGVPVVAGAEGGPLEILGPEAASRATSAGRLVVPGDPATLAGAVLELLPPGPTSTATRRSRSRLREPEAGRFSQLFADVLDGRVSRERPSRGGPRRPALLRRRPGRSR